MIIKCDSIKALDQKSPNPNFSHRTSLFRFKTMIWPLLLAWPKITQPPYKIRYHLNYLSILHIIIISDSPKLVHASLITTTTSPKTYKSGAVYHNFKDFLYFARLGQAFTLTNIPSQLVTWFLIYTPLQKPSNTPSITHQDHRFQLSDFSPPNHSHPHHKTTAKGT